MSKTVEERVKRGVTVPWVAGGQRGRSGQGRDVSGKAWDLEKGLRPRASESRGGNCEDGWPPLGSAGGSTGPREGRCHRSGGCAVTGRGPALPPRAQTPRRLGPLKSDNFSTFTLEF